MGMAFEVCIVSWVLDRFKGNSDHDFFWPLRIWLMYLSRHQNSFSFDLIWIYFLSVLLVGSLGESRRRTGNSVASPSTVMWPELSMGIFGHKPWLWTSSASFRERCQWNPMDHIICKDDFMVVLSMGIWTWKNGPGMISDEILRPSCLESC